MPTPVEIGGLIDWPPSLEYGLGGYPIEIATFGTTIVIQAPAPPPGPLPTTQANPLLGNTRATVDFGQDIDAFSDLNPALVLVGGLANLGQALAHRLETPRGSLFYAPNYGTDVRAYLNAAINPVILARLRSEVQGECLKDERVQTCSCTVTFNSALGVLNLQINVVTASGPFALELLVTALTVAVLSTPQVH